MIVYFGMKLERLGNRSGDSTGTVCKLSSRMQLHASFEADQSFWSASERLGNKSVAPSALIANFQAGCSCMLR